jgi:large subunit ribosomal protein L15
MTNHKRKKNTRMRGSKTHGYGSMKKHRGAGHRGGRGNAGSGKRSDAKKPSIWKNLRGDRDPVKIGFHSITGVTNTTINVGHLSSIADRLVAERKAVVTQGAYVINLREIGVTKLLGTGKVVNKLKVSVPIVVPGAKEKIEAAGGSVDAEIIVDKDAVKAAREAKSAEYRALRKKTPPQAAAPAKKDKAAPVEE